MSYDYVLHVSDVARWPATLSNLGNLTQLGLAHGIAGSSQCRVGSEAAGLE